VTGFAALCLVATAALLVAQRRDWLLGIWIAKPLAASAYIGAALALGALDTAYGRVVLAALMLSWFGDVFLIPRGAPRSFKAGVLSFLLAHVAFALAFALRGLDWLVVAVAALVAAAVAAALLRWLRPHLPRDLAAAVHVYVGVISLMLVTAAGTAVALGGASIFIGALMFYVSDLAVARERFVASSLWNGAWGLPLYFGGQLVLASTVAQGAVA
jgi:uncharacterized membrane protein YhhN